MQAVFEQLKCSEKGLSSDEGAKRLQVFGKNKLEEKKECKVLKFLGFMWNPLSWVMELAAIMAIALANGGVCNIYMQLELVTHFTFLAVKVMVFDNGL